MRFLIKFLICLIIGIFTVPMVVFAQNFPEVKIFNVSGELKKTFTILDSDYNGSISFAVGDTWAGDEKELVVCKGAGTSSMVLIYDLNGNELESFSPFGKSFRGGCFVDLADNNGDLKDEIIVSPGSGGGPHVKVFKGAYEQKGFFAFDKKLRNGVRVQSADFGNDNKAEIVAYNNYNQSAEYGIFGNDGIKITGYKLDGLNGNGLTLILGDFNGDQSKEIAYVGGYGSDREIVLVGKENKLIKKIPYADVAYRGNLNLAAGDTNGDGKDELIIAEGFGGSGKVTIYDYNGIILGSFRAYNDFSGGLNVAASDVDGDGQIEIVTSPEQIGVDLKSDAYKFITVDISKQTLYRYQDGKLLDAFLISSGKSPNITPKGEFEVFRKRPKVRMTGVDYDLPNVPWVASFNGPITIHGTYWHNNFGHPMSHGCINMKTPEAKIVYDWSEIGTPVIVY